MTIYEDLYSLAELEPHDLEEIQRFEQRLSSKFGHSISIVAYQSEPVEKFVD